MAAVREQYKVGQGGPGSSINVTFDSSVTADSLLLCCISFWGGTGNAVVTDDNTGPATLS
jgi:hypothetical protein